MATITELLKQPPTPAVATTEGAPPLQAPVAQAPAQDPYAEFSSPVSADPYAEFSNPVSDAFDEFSRPADDLDVRSVEELVADRDTFNPRDYYASNPDVARDPAKLSKLLAVRRQRDKEGLQASQVVKEAFKEGVPTVGKILGGARDLVAGAINAGLQPAVNLAGSVVTGDIFDPQMRRELPQETKRAQTKAIAEAAAGSETAALGLADLARTGLRKLDAAAGQAAVAELGEPPVEKSDAQLLEEMVADVEFGKQMQEVSSGKGETAKKLGLDAETLAKEGIVLDPAVIERLSLVDPLTIIAGGGVFKAVNAAGNVVFTAATRAAAERTIGKLLAQTVAAPVRAAGKTAELTGKVAKAVGPYVPLTGRRSVVTLGGKITEATGRGIAQAGESLANSATFQKALVGAVEGVATAAPLAAATDDDKTAGAIFGAGALLGGGARGLVSAAEAPGRIISGRKLAAQPITFPDTNSRPYGISNVLDSAHELGIKSLPKESQNTINSFRETVRDLGGEVYVLTPDVFEQTLLENVERANGGQPLSADQMQRVRSLAESQGYFDTSLPTPDGGLRRVVLLNNSAGAATHEVGHLFHSLLSPERQADLLNTAKQVFTPEEIAGYKKNYEEALGRPVTEAAFLDELVAENFSQLFRNTPVSELTAPRGLADKIGRTITDFAEQLGLDLTAETRTPLGLPSSLRFNDVVRDAARDILSPRAPEPVVAPRTPEGRTISPERVVVPRPPRARVERPTPEVEPRPAEPVSEVAAAEEARNIAAEAPDTPLAGGTRSPRELLGQIAESMTNQEGVKLNYLSAPDEPAAATTSNRTVRREIIEAFRTMPAEARALWEKTFFPEKVIRTNSGKYQVQGWAPEVFASNAHKLAKFLAETPDAQALSPYAIDPKTKSFTPEAWQELYQDTQRFVQNQIRGATGAGDPLVVPRSVTEAGGFAPATRPGARALDQGRADFINMLFGFKLPETPRMQVGQRPRNVMGQEVSAATMPGRVEVPVRPRGEFTGAEAARQGIEGVAIAEVNPLRNQFEAAALAAKKPMPSFIEAIQKLNLENIKEVVGAPEQPQFRGNSLTLGAGFQPKDWRVLVDQVEKFSPEEFRNWVSSVNNNFTQEAWNVGRSAPDQAFVDSLKSRYDQLSKDLRPKIQKAMQAGKLDDLSALASQAQFFKEAHEAATGTGSAVQALRKIEPDYKAPFPQAEAAAKFQPAPADDIRTLADEYAKRAGLPYEPKLKTAAPPTDLLKQVADFYETAKSAPDDPAVRASYDALSQETIDQYNAIVDAGYTLEPWEGTGEPYKASADMVADVRDNKHLYYFKTDKGFGGEGDATAQNAMLADSGISINGEAVPVNDLFRAVHDFFGHAKEGHQFGPKGEFNAWGTHAEMFSDAAQGALAAETLAQNAFVNFGPHMRSDKGAILQKGEPGYLNLPDRPFAEQKNVVVPPEIIAEARAQFAPRKKKGEDPYTFKAPKAGFSKAWILPNGDPVQLGGTWHHQWLSENPDVAAKYKLDVPEFKGGDAEGVREGALKAGFARINYSQNSGTLTVEARARDWRRVKGAVERMVESNLDNIDKMEVQLLNEAADKVVDSQSSKLFNYDDAEKLQHLPFITEGEVRGSFSPSPGKLANSDGRSLNRDDAYSWLSPEGVFTPVPSGKTHAEIVWDLLGVAPKRGADAVGEAWKAGYARITRYGDEVTAHKEIGEFSRKQRDALINLGLETEKRKIDFDTGEDLKTLWLAEDDVRGSFSAGEFSLDDPRAAKGIQKVLRTQVTQARDQYPEALPLEYRKEEDGSYRVDAKGQPTPVGTTYDLFATPLAKEAAKGKRGDEARNAAVVNAYADKIQRAYKKAAKNPDIAAGANWYSLAREKLSKLFGPDTKFFTELLGATSAQTDVATNFRNAVEAYNLFKEGKYDAQIKKYREGVSIWDWPTDLPAEANLGDKPTRAAFMKWWIDKHDLKPRKANGKLFGANSDAVMRVLDSSWREEVKGPKTPNFAGNLSGDSFEATIDIWAARLLHRLGNEGNEKRWRILPKNETGVSDPDFFLGQKAFRKAGDALGISPDSLQAIMWFAEKDVWEKKGWTKLAGSLKSDFNTFLDVTAKEQPSGRVRISEEDLKKPEKKADKKQLELLSP